MNVTVIVSYNSKEPSAPAKPAVKMLRHVGSKMQVLRRWQAPVLLRNGARFRVGRSMSDAAASQEGQGAQPRVTDVNEKLAQILVCPLTKTKMRYDAEKQELVSDAAGVAFAVVDGIPNMVPAAARKLAPETTGKGGYDCTHDS